MKKIANYEIIEEINRGATTVVYKARQASLDRIILLKVLNENLSNEKDIVARFQREAKACARIKHENIVDVFDYGFDNGCHYIAMEYVEGVDLEQLLKKADVVPLEIIAFIFIEVLKGLAFGHSKGILHRDIKPANILLSYQGKVKITDFGLAIISDSKAVTIQNTILGTPGYMSPEQINGDKLDGRTDIFSLGVTLYEMLTNKQAFAGETFSESINNILNKEPAKIEKLRPGLPPELVSIVKKMIRKKPARRFENCEAVLSELYLFAKNNQLALTKSSLKNYVKDQKRYSSTIIEHGTVRLPNKIFKVLKSAAIIIFLTLLFVVIYRSIDYFLSQKNQLVDSSNHSADSLSIFERDNPEPIETEVDSTIPLVNIDSNADSQKNKIIIQENIVKPLNHLTQKKEGILIVKCAPWAKIFVDGKFQKTLFEADSLKIKTTPGSHKITFINSEFAPYDTGQVVAQVKTGKITNLQIPYVETVDVGFLKIIVNPWAEVYVNGIHKGTTPMNPIVIKQGEHLLELKHPQIENWQQNFEIKTGETHKISINLSNINGVKH